MHFYIFFFFTEQVRAEKSKTTRLRGEDKRRFAVTGKRLGVVKQSGAARRGGLGFFFFFFGPLSSGTLRHDAWGCKIPLRISMTETFSKCLSHTNPLNPSRLTNCQSNHFCFSNQKKKKKKKKSSLTPRFSSCGIVVSNILFLECIDISTKSPPSRKPFLHLSQLLSASSLPVRGH